MKKLFIISIFVFIVTAGSVFGQWEYSECLTSMPGAEGHLLALFNIPDGTGSSFYNAQIYNDGAVIDAHIELIVNDAFGYPVPNFPAEDMWLASSNGGLTPCDGGTSPDQDTDANGFTIWANPLRAGGSDTGSCSVIVDGYEVVGGEGSFPLAFNSPDITGDGIVNLADVGLFSAILFGEYDFAADFFSDGVMNLADVGRMASGIGKSCPR